MSSKSSGSDVEDKTVDANQDGKPVDKKVAVAVKHPGVFMETCELEAEAGVKIALPPDSKPKKEDEEEKVEGFDPSTYIIGPEEELPRRLEHFTFVMHAPDDYFYYQNAPYPTTSINRDQEYVLTRLGPKVRLLKNNTASFS